MLHLKYNCSCLHLDACLRCQAENKQEDCVGMFLGAFCCYSLKGFILVGAFLKLQANIFYLVKCLLNILYKILRNIRLIYIDTKLVALVYN